MERSEIIKQIKMLVEEANTSIKEKHFIIVYENYTKVADLCKQIGDEKNANSYMEAANKFKKRAEVVEHEKELRDAINKALALAKIANENKEYSRVSDIYYSIASKLYDLKDEETAKKFSDAARKFREKAALEEVPKEVKPSVPTEIQESTDVAPIDQFASALKIGVEAKKTEPPPDDESVPFTPPPTMKEPIKIPPASALGEMDVNLDKLDQFLLDLGLKCPSCGKELSEEESATLSKCPNCGNNLV
ncbi:MAG: hypothetical protein HWN67_15235 [Candidatus Helarchaeota archaeon]|nr:hypothetical protein [Candidatus Helarchaeota archaeon]